MIMIPPTIDETNFAEKKVFSKLKNDKNPETKNWIVYHSLNYPVSVNKKDKKSFKYFGEADFVILIPNKGIINIEVKGWTKFSCENGVWKITKNDGTIETNKKSPIKQAQDSKYNIRKYIELTINRKFPQEWMVVFPQASLENIRDNIEYPDENIVDTDSFNLNFIKRLTNLSKLLKTGGGFFEINNKDLKILKEKVMRPNFKVFIKKPTILNDSEIEIFEYTEEQLLELDYLEEGERILVTGSQGTGKSSIAEEVIRREISKETKKILFLNSNKGASEDMQFKLKDLDKTNFSSTTFYKLISQIVKSYDKTSLNQIYSMKFFEKHEFLINKAIEFLKNDSSKFKDKFIFDFIVFDEMQNCYFYEKFYDLLELILKDGLVDGKYCLLGDFKYQSLVSDELIIDGAKHPKNYLMGYDQIRLTKNVRNSKKISTNAPILSGLFKKFPYQISKSEHGDVFNSFSKTTEEKIMRLETILKDLKTDGVKGYDIVILSNFKLGNKNNFISSVNVSKYYEHIIDLTDNNIRNLNQNLNELKKENSIYFSTVHAFQGLESKIVIYVDPLEDLGSFQADINLKPELLAFNAMGRANTYLYLLWDSRLKKFHDDKLEIIGKLSF
tara:strand:- start:6758 stop:8599 length:1842 start_codon:yes stop_codon:yes gene_type:complete